MMMKSDILKNNKFKALWIAIHGLIFLTIGVLFFTGTKLKISTNLFEILPKTNSSREVSKADAKLNGKTGRTFIILVKENTFEAAKTNAVALYNQLNSEENKSVFESLNLYTDKDALKQIADFYFENRFTLLSEENIKMLSDNNGAEAFIEEALLSIFSGWSDTSRIEEDPFCLADFGFQDATHRLLKNGTSMTLMDGVLFCFKDSYCYVMLRGVLTPEGASITNKNSGVKKIYESAEKIKNEGSKDLDFIFSGVPFHSYESSSSAQKEIMIISIVSLALIILICLYVFRNILPVISSVCAITISALFAVSSVLIVFREIHILTFVFGTTLIGTCLDYSVHFFVRWKGDTQLNSGLEIKNHLMKGLSLSLLSTEICYLLLCFAPFALLKQVAVFSLTGILSSYLTVICLYPMFKVPEQKGIYGLKGKVKGEGKFFSLGKVKYVAIATIVIVFILTIVVKHKNVRIENDLKSFYTMSGHLLENEKEAGLVLDSGSSGWYFIVQGNSETEVLENESKLCKKLDSYISRSSLVKMTYNSITKYIPPVSQQEKSYKAVEELLPYAKSQFITLGYDNNEAVNMTANFKKSYHESKEKFVNLNSSVPEFMKDAVSNLWIGEIDGKWYSVVMPMHFKESDYCKELAQEDENVFFMNKVQDIGNELNVLTKLMLVFLLIAFVIMSVVLKCFYEWKKVLKIIVIPVITVLGCVAVLALKNVPLGFFSVTGVILVFGLSIDYIIYAVENSEKLNSIAIVLSFLSSALSFGALALSSFAPVYMFGLTVFAGLMTAVIFTGLLKD